MKSKTPKLEQLLVCLRCKGSLLTSKSKMICKKCKKVYQIDRGIPSFLPRLDKNKEYQMGIWDDKTYKVDPENHVFTTIQEHFGNKMLRNLKIPNGGVVLDVGCFIGEKLWQLKDNKNYLGVGIDIAVESLIAASEIDKYGHKFIAADLEHLPFKDNSVDCVLIFDVIEHLSDQEKGFAEVSRVLKPGGTFLLHIPIKDNDFSLFWLKQKLVPNAAMKDYLDVGHTPERMLTTEQIKDYLIKYKMDKSWEIFYNSFFVHFFDREMMKIIGFILTNLMGKRTIRQEERIREVHVGSLGKMRNLYGKYAIPLFSLLSIPDKLLSYLKVGNTYFIYSVKK
jgi:ubiquinone/menaquinone biosynthesis C-methylase UbiE